MVQRRRGTSTSAFGVGRREAHDATGFYERFPLPELNDDATVVRYLPAEPLMVGDSRSMTELKDASVALVVTSPPYFAGKAYEADLGEGHVPGSYIEYLAMLRDVFAECRSKLEPGGRIAVNVANLGRKPYRSLAADVVGILQDDLKLLLRGEIIWQKARGSTGSCAWGSFKSPRNPVLRDITERVVIASKGRFDRAVSVEDRESVGLPYRATVTSDEFLAATLDVWELASESARRVSHPAPFPVELPERLIELYTFADDLVLDPFLGSGTTAVAAVRTGRQVAGYDTDPAYIEIARRRMHAEGAALAAGPDQRRAGRAVAGSVGLGVRDLCARVLAEAGFTGIARPTGRPGLTATLVADDSRGRRWHFDVVGSFAIGDAGLARADAAMAALGRASVLRAAGIERLVLLTSELPPPRSTLGRAIASVRGNSFVDAIEALAPEGRSRLVELARGGDDG